MERRIIDWKRYFTKINFNEVADGRVKSGKEDAYEFEVIGNTTTVMRILIYQYQ
jgi:hypothetical protein